MIILLFYNRFFMVDVYSDVKNTMKYYGNSTSPGAHFPINFNFITKFNKQSNAYDVDAIIKSWMLNMPDGCWPNWIVSIILIIIVLFTKILLGRNKELLYNFTF